MTDEEHHTDEIKDAHEDRSHVEELEEKQNGWREVKDFFTMFLKKINRFLVY